MRESTGWAKAVTAGLGIILLGGCAAIQAQQTAEIEQLLPAAGFRKVVADTPKRAENIKKLTPRKMVRHTKDGKIVYTFADPTGCNCVYVGNEQAFQKYQQLLMSQRMATESEGRNDQTIMDYEEYGTP